jgi:hypothetical protein
MNIKITLAIALSILGTVLTYTAKGGFAAGQTDQRIVILENFALEHTKNDMEIVKKLAAIEFYLEKIANENRLQKDNK